MHVNGIKSFKIETVDDTAQNGGQGYGPKADGVDTTLDDAFGSLYGTDSTPDVSTSGWVVRDPAQPDVDSYDAQVLTGLSDYPPSLDYIIAQNEQAIRYIDVIKARYEKTKEDLIALRDSYNTDLLTATAAQAVTLQEKIGLVDAAIAKTKREIDSCVKRMDDSASKYEQERMEGKDLDGDGWIGRSGADGSLKVLYQDGKPIYMDSGGNIVKNAFLDPDYEAKIVTDDSLTAIQAEDSIGHGGEDVENADLYFKLNELKPDYTSEDNKFGTPINIGVPEYIYVPRRKNSWEPDDDPNDDSYAFKPDLWEGGVQRKPDNMTDYVQVRVANVVVSSEPAIETDDGEELYNTIIEFEDADGQTILTIKIEGYYDATGSCPAGVSVGGQNYVAASTVGIGFYGADRVSPLNFDASGYKSTGRHIVDDMAGALGITPSDHIAYDEQMGLFEDQSPVTKHWEVEGEKMSSTGGWVDDVHDFDYGAGYHDTYTAEEPTAETDTVDSFKTGVFVTGLRGNFVGSKDNDVFDIPDVNFTNDYIEAHTPKDAEKLVPEDPLYWSTVDGNNGNNIVRAGKGNLVADDVCFAWVDASRKDDVMIRVSKMVKSISDSENADAAGDILADFKNFVHVDGARTASVCNHYENQDSQDITGFYAGYNGDDYYEGITNASDPDDVEGRPDNDYGDDEFRKDWEQFSSDVDAAIAGIGDEEVDIDLPTKWNEEYGYAEEQDAEMDDFFDQVFGDLNEFETEMQGRE